MREPGEDDPDEDIIPYDPAWWADFNRRCNELTPAEIESMGPQQVEVPVEFKEEMEAETLEEIFTRMRAKRTMQKPEVKEILIRDGLYRLENVTCSCGGSIHAEKFGSTVEYRWETFCSKCGDCDPNGWPTLQACKENGVLFFKGK